VQGWTSWNLELKLTSPHSSAETRVGGFSAFFKRRADGVARVKAIFTFKRQRSGKAEELLSLFVLSRSVFPFLVFLLFAFKFQFYSETEKAWKLFVPITCELRQNFNINVRRPTTSSKKKKKNSPVLNMS